MVILHLQGKNIKLLALFICLFFSMKQGYAKKYTQEDLFNAIKMSDEKSEQKVIELINTKYSTNRNPYNYTYHGKPILHHAVRLNKKGITQHLIELGFPINDHTKNNITPLHIASLMGFYDLACYLVQEGADVNATTYDMQSPLHFAAQQNHDKIVAMLLKNGANPHIVSIHNKKAYEIALENNDTACASIFAPYIENPNTMLGQPLHIAAHNGDLATIEKLITQGAYINCRDNKNATPMHYAAHNNHADIVAFLAQNGAYIDIVDDRSFDPLCIAACYGNTKTVKRLLELGANITTTTLQKKLTPLHLAVKANSLETVSLLIEKGAPIDALSELRNTPLHFAASHGYQDICKKLIEHGANRHLVNAQGDTPFTIAMKKNHETIVPLVLPNYQSDQIKSLSNIYNNDNDNNTTAQECILSPTLFHDAIQKNDLNEIKRLIERNIDVNSCDKFNIPPLFYAVDQNQLEIVEALLKAGASVNHKEPRHKATPLHFAATKGYTSIAKCLIKHGALVNISDPRYGLNPLHAAAQGGHLETVQCLLNGGARKNTITREGFLACELAEYWQETLPQPTEISKKLIEILNPKLCPTKVAMCSFPLPKL
ncbi:MAG: hypothetical protein US69_C0002G0103 [candidate division TM6 bacterium GW2011_GWF2_38_10]|nr:MAG: hypothetical protein US69_C0002G0103 [candidate division TM6 bacterium GW2011_GWF2_38_10]